MLSKPSTVSAHTHTHTHKLTLTQLAKPADRKQRWRPGTFAMAFNLWHSGRNVSRRDTVILLLLRLAIVRVRVATQMHEIWSDSHSTCRIPTPCRQLRHVETVLPRTASAGLCLSHRRLRDQLLTKPG